MILTFFCCGIYVYFGFFTTYVLIIDIGFACFGLFFTFFEIVFGIAAAARFKKN